MVAGSCHQKKLSQNAIGSRQGDFQMSGATEVCQKAKSPRNENLAALIKLTAAVAGQIREATNRHFQVRTYTLLSQRPDF